MSRRVSEVGAGGGEGGPAARSWRGRGEAEGRPRKGCEADRHRSNSGGETSVSCGRIQQMLLRINFLLFCPAGSLGKYRSLSINEFRCLILFLNDCFQHSLCLWRRTCETGLPAGRGTGGWRLCPPRPFLHVSPSRRSQEGNGAVACVTLAKAT